MNMPMYYTVCPFHFIADNGHMNEVLNEYTDTSGVHHLIVSSGDKTGDVVEYISLLNCPFCGRNLLTI